MINIGFGTTFCNISLLCTIRLLLVLCAQDEDILELDGGWLVGCLASWLASRQKRGSFGFAPNCFPKHSVKAQCINVSHV
jgi:hypothetical protein